MNKDSSDTRSILTKFTQSKDIVLADIFFIGLIVIGIIVKLIGSIGVETLGQATASLWGYNIILFALIGIMILKLDTSEYMFMKQIKHSYYYVIIVLMLKIKYLIL